MQPKKMAIATSVIAVIVIASAFTKYSQPSIIAETRNSFFNKVFVTQYLSDYYKPEKYPDTTIQFKNPYPNGTSTYKYTLGNVDGLYMLYNFCDAVNDSISIKSKEFNAEFKKRFGVGFHGTHVKMAQSKFSSELYSVFFFYSPVGIKTAFDKMYVKPDASFQGYALQHLYNLSAKEEVLETIRALNKLLTNKAVFVQQCNLYLSQAKTNKSFYHGDITYKTYKKLVPNWKQEEENDDKYDYISNKLLGPLMRRQCDGTLPVLISCFKQFLKDYDPEALKLLKI